MRVSSWGSMAAVLAGAALYACGSSGDNATGGPDASADGAGQGDGGNLLGSDGTSPDVVVTPPFVDGGFTAGDCDGGGCTFPPPGAMPCANAPAINLVYPADGTLVPPNMSVMSVMWTPYGAGFKTFEVDFENSITYMHVVTKCAQETVDTEQPPQPSGGCELQLDPAMWKFVADQNRGLDPVNITVRGTTDGVCASTSTSSVRLSFASDDILGAIYYWKSTVSANGTGGQVWVKSWGDQTPEQDVTSKYGSTCNGCHALSRDGQRMVINSDDDDSDDEYGDVRASLIDMVAQMPVGGGGGRGNLNPGFGSFYPDHSRFLMSNGLGAASAPTNRILQYDGNTAMAQPTVTVAGQSFVTMEDWSADGKSVVFVVPSATATWDVIRNDDDHIFGGSIYQMPYMGSGAFGPAAPLFVSGGENNYYPSYSPDSALIVFNRAPHDTSVSPLNGCKGLGTPQASCPNDSFSNPNARLMLTKVAQGSSPVDLEKANGSPASAPVPLSNSWPKWSPFLQSYKGDQLLWIAFSSTRDYGLRVRNHQPGMFQCYPPDSYEQPGAAHHSAFSPQCQQPQIWMAAIDVTAARGAQKSVAGAMDPSYPGFWLPFQDITTHNHTPQWTQTVANNPPPDAGACVQANGNCTQGGTCCSGLVCQASGTCGPLAQ